MTMPRQSQNLTENQSENQSENLADSSQSSLPNEEVAPKKTRKPRSPNGQAVRADNTYERIRTGLTLVFGTASTLTSFANKTDAMLIQQHSAVIIDSIIELSKQDKGVRTFLLSMSETSAWGNVCMASLPLVIAILANHNLIPNLFRSPEAPQDANN